MLIILVGNVGTGKTHYRKINFNNGEKIICLDEWQNLSKIEKEDKFISELHNFLSKGKTIIVDGNNINQNARKKYVTFANNYQCKLKAIDFGPGSNQTLQRRLNKIDIKDHPIWITSHHGYKNHYQKPTYEEGFDLITEKINYEIDL